MKAKALKSIPVTAIVFLLILPVNSQSRVKIYSTDDNNLPCAASVSAYRTFFKENLYSDAYPTWLRAFNACADSSERVYVDGATMYRSFIESSPIGPIREGRIDTLMLIYDRRMEYFGGEGNVLGRKGRDLLAYRGSDITQVKQANDMLRRSIEIQGQESRESVMQLCISSDVVLNKEELLNENQILADYLMIIGHLDQLEESSSRWKRTRSNIDQILLKEGILSCKKLDIYFEPLMAQYQSDTAFQESILSSYRPLECEHSPIILTASENLYRLFPGQEPAHKLALQFIADDDLNRAIFYLQKALEGEDISEETRAQWYYELALVNNAIDNYCQAIENARESLKLKTSNGKVYLLLGDAIISSRRNLGNDFQKRTAYWAAADMYNLASEVDQALSEEARKKLTRCEAQFPDKEDIFFSDIREGEAYLVEGCINETTTVRSRK